MLRFDFVGRAQQKALPVGASNVEPRKESMSSLRISGQGRGSMRKALRLQPWVAWPAMADDLTAGLDFGLGRNPCRRLAAALGTTAKAANPGIGFSPGWPGARRSTATATTHLVLPPRPFWGLACSAPPPSLRRLRSGPVVESPDRGPPWLCESYAASAKPWDKRRRSPCSVAARKSLSCLGSCGKVPRTSC